MSYTQKDNTNKKSSKTPSNFVCVTYPKKKIPYWWDEAFVSFNDFVQDYLEMYTHPGKSWEKYQKALFKRIREKDKIEKEQPYKSTLYTSPY
jgi:hypothetical protein